MSSKPRPPLAAAIVRQVPAAVLFATLVACASAPPAPGREPARARPVVPLDTKVSWLLRLEQERVLRVEQPGSQTTSPEGAATPGQAPGTPVFVPAIDADLADLLMDPDPALRRRAALAVARVGLPEGVALLIGRLGDPDEGVREMAAFGLGLLGSTEAVGPLADLLRTSPSPALRGRVIEALGLIGDGSAAPDIVRASSGCGPLLAPIEPDTVQPQASEVEACRLALLSLVRLGDRDALRSVALDASGQPVSRWWPVAFALQRSGSPDAPALLTLVSSSGIYTPAFALRALASLKDPRVVPLAKVIALADVDLKLRVAAVRALGPFDQADVGPTLLEIVRNADTPPNLALEAVSLVDGDGAFDVLLDLFAHPWPAMRAAAMRRAAAIDAEGFLVVLSSLGADPDWSVRAAIPDILAGMPGAGDRVMAWVLAAADDQDVRVRGAALGALARLSAPDIADRLFEALDASDYSLRATAARLVGQRRPAGGVERLVAAYERGDSDATPQARSAAIEALARYGTAEAVATIRRALEDREWPVRLQASELLGQLGEADARPRRPAPIRQPPGFFESPALLHPSFSPHAFVETRHGTIEIELNVVEAAVTTQTFIELARAGFFNGLRVHRLIAHFVMQAGDPRGEGSGGPGFTQRDELSPIPFLRGTVGMALSGPDTGGSQFFIALSPQPHLDGRYTVFGQVVSGEELLDQVALWDVIERVRIWDGVTLR
ncbi:MAG TPA: HEAT repeat domain-containing protein [Vicinamibacterales bacterium]|nr:HEAT repeat domain-containing protein [Vicinamibacterales bacterium]